MHSFTIFRHVVRWHLHPWCDVGVCGCMCVSINSPRSGCNASWVYIYARSSPNMVCGVSHFLHGIRQDLILPFRVHSPSISFVCATTMNPSHACAAFMPAHPPHRRYPFPVVSSRWPPLLPSTSAPSQPPVMPQS